MLHLPLPLPTLVLAALAAGGCSRAPRDTPAALEAPGVEPAPAAVMGTLVAINSTWGDAFARGDDVRIAATYADDAVLMTMGGDVTGRDAIREFFRVRFAARTDTVLATATHTELVDVAGHRAYEAGTITYTVAPRARPAASRAVTARYMTFWELDAGAGWRVRRSLRPLP